MNPAPPRNDDAAAVRLPVMERAALAVARYANETPAAKRIAHRLMISSVQWVRHTVGPRVLVDRLDEVRAMDPDRGVLFVANHRSFFDMYVVMLAMFWSGEGWTRRMFFPVRSTFFYESAPGVLLNLAMAGGSMYPPIFRQRERAPLNRVALARLAESLALPGTLVGMHPEGTRGKGDDPYDLLPMQPGVGHLIVQARPIVIPLFINGLTNDFFGDTRDTYRANSKRERPILLTFGAPMDFADLFAQTARAATYKRVADRVRDGIAACGERERLLRREIGDHTIADDDPRWLINKPRGN